MRAASITHTGFHAQLAALLGYVRLSSRTALSGFLRALGKEAVDGLLREMLLWALPLPTVQPQSVCHDAQGQPMIAFDLDARVEGVRLRALPEDEALPEPQRVGEALTASGYPGRKRLDHVYNTLILTMAASAHVLWLDVQRGGACMADAIDEVLAQMKRAAEQMQWSCSNMLLRIDGAGGNSLVIKACRAAGVALLTRLSNYPHLERMTEQLAALTWRAVADSGSGPRREAAELGLYPVADVLVRTVVSRFPARDGKKHGAGWVHLGYQYELFAVEGLDPGRMPAADAVSVYYERCGQCETRYGQMDREIALLSHISSFCVQGQQLVMALCALWWNLKRHLGQEADALSALSPQLRAEPLYSEVVLSEEHRPEPAPRAVLCTPAGQVDVDEYLTSEAAKVQLHQRHGDRFDAATLDAASVQCQGGQRLTVKRLRTDRGRQDVEVIYRAPVGVCSRCPVRAGCMRSSSRQARKEFSLHVPAVVNASSSSRAEAEPDTVPAVSEPAVTSRVERFTATHEWTPDRSQPHLARAATERALKDGRVWIGVTPGQDAPREPSATEWRRRRRHGRMSIEQGEARHRLPAGSRTALRVEALADACPFWKRLTKPPPP